MKSLSKDKSSLKSKISNLQLKQEELKQKIQKIQEKVNEQQEKIDKQQKKIQEQKLELNASSEEKIELNTRLKQQEADLERNKNKLENILVINFYCFFLQKLLTIKCISFNIMLVEYILVWKLTHFIFNNNIQGEPKNCRIGRRYFCDTEVLL